MKLNKAGLKRAISMFTAFTLLFSLTSFAAADDTKSYTVGESEYTILVPNTFKEAKADNTGSLITLVDSKKGLSVSIHERIMAEDRDFDDEQSEANAKLKVLLEKGKYKNIKFSKAEAVTINDIEGMQYKVTYEKSYKNSKTKKIVTKKYTIIPTYFDFGDTIVTLSIKGETKNMSKFNGIVNSIIKSFSVPMVEDEPGDDEGDSDLVDDEIL